MGKLGGLQPPPTQDETRSPVPNPPYLVPLDITAEWRRADQRRRGLLCRTAISTGANYSLASQPRQQISASTAVHNST